MKALAQLKSRMLASEATRAAYDGLADEFAMARELIAAPRDASWDAQMAEAMKDPAEAAAWRARSTA